MCGIVGYIGHREAAPLILDSLRKLEYRGYDSAGIAVLNDGQVVIQRCEGKLSNLATLLERQPLGIIERLMQQRVEEQLAAQLRQHRVNADEIPRLRRVSESQSKVENPAVAELVKDKPSSYGPRSRAGQQPMFRICPIWVRLNQSGHSGGPAAKHSEEAGTQDTGPRFFAPGPN